MAALAQMSVTWRGSKGTKDRTIAEFVHLWLKGKLGGSGETLATVPDFMPWFKLHMVGLPKCARILCDDSVMKVCFARTTCEGPIIPGLLTYLEERRAANPRFVSSLATPVEGMSVHLSLLLYGLILSHTKSFVMLVREVSETTVMGLIPINDIVRLTDFLVPGHYTIDRFKLDDKHMCTKARSQGQTVCWPQIVVDKVKDRAALAKQQRKDEIEGVGEDESDFEPGEGEELEGESEAEEDECPERGSGGPGGSGGSSSRKRGSSTVAAGSSVRASDGGQADKRSCDHASIVKRLIREYRDMTAEDQGEFRRAVNMEPAPPRKEPKPRGPPRTGPPAVTREMRGAHDLFVRDKIGAIGKEMADKEGTPFPDILNPPAWFIRMRTKYRIGEILGELEQLLTTALHDAYVYWIFFRRLICSIKKTQVLTPAGNLSKALDVGGIVLEVLHDMLPVFFYWSSHKKYAVSGGLYYVKWSTFIPFEETPFFEGGNIPAGVKECYTGTLAALTEQGWPLSLARHLAFLKTSRHPLYVEQAKKDIANPLFKDILGKSSLNAGLAEYLEEHPTRLTGYDVRALQLDLSPPPYMQLPGEMVPVSNASDDEDAPPPN